MDYRGAGLKEREREREREISSNVYNFVQISHIVRSSSSTCVGNLQHRLFLQLCELNHVSWLGSGCTGSPGCSRTQSYCRDILQLNSHDRMHYY